MSIYVRYPTVGFKIIIIGLPKDILKTYWLADTTQTFNNG